MRNLLRDKEKAYENREIYKVDVFINQGMGTYQIGKEGIARIEDESVTVLNSYRVGQIEKTGAEMVRRYTCYDKEGKILCKIENCNVVVSYREGEGSEK